MKAVAVFPSRHEVGLIQTAEPSITAAGQAKVRILDVGICGTDREICACEYGTPPAGSDHLVIGHEALGEVVEVGPAVTGLRAGDLVVPMVRRPCPHDRCPACRSGRQDFCYTGDFTERGIKEAHGFLTETIVEEEQYLIVVPPEFRDVAVLVEPLTIAEKAAAQARQIQQRLPWASPARPGRARGHAPRAVVLGAGPVGLLGAMACMAADCETYVYSRDPADGGKASLTRSIGATFISAETVSVTDLVDMLGEIDLVFEAAGASRVAFELLAHLGPNGVFCFTGVPGRKAPIEVDTDLLMRNLVLKNHVVFGTVNAGRESYQAAVDDLGVFLRRWPDAVRSLITGRYPPDAHRDLLFGRPNGIKNVISFA